MALPLTDLRIHVDVSDNARNFTTYVNTGVHTGVPADGGVVQVLDDQTGSIVDIAFVASPTAAAPNYRSVTPLMPLPCLDFNGTDQVLTMMNQNGTATRVTSDILAAHVFSSLVAIRAEAVTLNDASVWLNHCVWGDNEGYCGLFLQNVGGTTPTAVYFIYDGAAKTMSIPLPAGDHVIYCGLNGGLMHMSIDDQAEIAPVACGPISNVSTVFQIGKGLAASSSFLNGRFGELAFWNNVLSGPDKAQALTHFNSKWLAATALIKKYRIPTSVADGTQRKLFVFSSTALTTPLVSNAIVTAAGGFFKHADPAASVGTKYPCALLGFGADDTVDARGAPAWATGIEE